MTSKTPIAAELTFADIGIGDAFELQKTFAKEEVMKFAELSGDFSPLHVSEDYARETEFGHCVVHGMLLASLFSNLVGMHIPGKHALYLGQDLFFRRPVKVGETVTARAKVSGKSDVTRSVQLATEIRNAEDAVVVSGSAKVKLRETAPLPSAPEAPAQAEARARLEHPVALVTGASRGIGAEIARSFGERGFSVVVNYHRSEDLARRVVNEIAQGGERAVAIQADVRSESDVRRMFESAREELGGVDVLVNCATGEMNQQSFAEMPWSAVLSQLEMQVKAAMLTSQAVYPIFKERGQGNIVNILSQVTEGAPPPRVADYVTAKHALLGISRALAVEWADDRIRVNMVSPSLIQTDLTSHYNQRLFKMEANRTPLKRLATPRDVANMVAFLTSEEASYLTGMNLFVTGGQVLR